MRCISAPLGRNKLELRNITLFPVQRGDAVTQKGRLAPSFVEPLV
jgi:hypothetical protein